MPNVLKISEISSAAASSEIDANAWLEVSVDVAGTPTTKYLTGEVLKEVIRDEFGDSFIVGGTGIDVVHDDALNTLTISVTANTYQPLDAGLTSIAGLTTAADKMIYTTALDTYAVTDLSAFARTILDDADALTARATLGLVIGTNVQAYSANLGAIAALAVTDGNIIVGNGTTWVAESGATARTSLGLGNVENTALSTWAGSTSITTLGTIATGVWNGTVIDSAYIDQSLSVATLTASTSVTVASDLTLASGSITSASGAISFGDENLSTTGTWASGVTTINSGAVNTALNLISTDPTVTLSLQDDTTTAAGYVAVTATGNTLFLIGGAASGASFNGTTWDFQSKAFTNVGTLASGNATVTGTLAVTGVATFSNRIRFGAGTYPGGGIPSAYTTAVEGLTITSSAGSSYDFLLANGSGQSVLLVPTGTTGIQVIGSATIASDLTLASGSITSASGAISFGNENLSTTGTLASGNATVASATPFMRVQDSDSAGTAAVPIFELYDSTSRIGYLGFTSAVTGHMSLVNSVTNGDLNITTTGTGSIILSASGTGAIALQENTTVTGSLSVSKPGNSFPASFVRTGDPRTLYTYSDAGGVGVFGNSSASLSGAQLLYLTTSGIFYDVPTGDTHEMRVNSTSVLSVASTGATVTGTLGVTGKITGAASTTSAATINLPAGTAPTSPAESDMWFVGDVMYRRIGGVTKSVTFT